MEKQKNVGHILISIEETDLNEKENNKISYFAINRPPNTNA